MAEGEQPKPFEPGVFRVEMEEMWGKVATEQREFDKWGMDYKNWRDLQIKVDDSEEKAVQYAAETVLNCSSEDRAKVMSEMASAYNRGYDLTGITRRRTWNAGVSNRVLLRAIEILEERQETPQE